MTHFTLQPFSIILFIISLLTLALAIFTWQRRQLASWTFPFLILLISSTIWAFGYAIEIGVAQLSTKIVWAKFQYIGIAYAPLAWFVFTQYYTGRRRWVGRHALILFNIIVWITICLVMTNEFHHLIWQTTELIPAPYFLNLTVTYGAWFWIHLVFSYLFMIGGTFTIFHAYIRFGVVFRPQNIFLLISALIPWTGNVLYITGLNPFPPLDMSPFGFGVAGLAIGIAIFKVKFFDLIPMARRVVVDNMSDAFIVVDARQRIIDCNVVGQQLLGDGVRQILGMNIQEALPHIKEVLEVEQQGTLVEIELEQAGHIRFYDLLISPVYDDSFKLGGSVICLRDITKRKQVEAALVKRNQILEAFDSLSKDIISTLEVQPILNTAVKSAAQILDVTSAYINHWDESRGTITAIAEYYSPDASEAERVSDMGVSYSLKNDFGYDGVWLQNEQTHYIAHLDDLDIPVEEREHMQAYDGKTVLEIILQAKGKQVGTLELWESRHKRHFTEEEITAVKSLVHPIALAIDNAYLHQEVVAASQLKSKLLAQVNHELRTPLSVILLYIELMGNGRYGELSEQQANAISRVFTNAKYLKTLVERLLTQAEIESGTLKLKSEPFAPAAIVEQVDAQMSMLAQKKGLSFQTTVSDDMFTSLLGDSHGIKQILINLIDNAIKYTEQGGVEVSLCRHGEVHWAMSVTDTGIGICEENLNTIFTPFWQVAKKNNTSPVDGVGLGLSIIKQLVDLMGGNISVDSSLGKGSTFKVILPIMI